MRYKAMYEKIKSTYEESKKKDHEKLYNDLVLKYRSMLDIEGRLKKEHDAYVKLIKDQSIKESVAMRKEYIDCRNKLQHLTAKHKALEQYVALCLTTAVPPEEPSNG